MGKKERKEKKSKKKSKNRSDDAANKAGSDEAAQELSSLTTALQSGSNKADNTKSIPISIGININANNYTKSQSAGGWSWGAAFAAASTIRPNEDDLDDDFLERTKASDAAFKDGDGVGNISSLAKGYVSKEPVNYSESKGSDAGSDSDKDDGEGSVKSEEGPLEGRIISLSSHSQDQSLVLVNKQRGEVYSSGARRQDGRRLLIGKIVGGNIQLDQGAVEEMKQLEEKKTEVQNVVPSFPYPTNSDDHCETPMKSYRDIIPILDELCKSLGKNKTTLGIYDPYYCNGSVVNHLESLGYTNVYNRKENCYAVWEAKKEPPFHVLLTNPPYSEDHIDKLMRYITSPTFDKPFLLLMPQWVHKKDYYIDVTTGGKQTLCKKRKRGKFDKSGVTKCNPFYIVPKKRYVYLPPPDFREKKVSDVHKKSAPFTSMWFVWGGTHERNEALMEAFRKSAVKGCELARSRSALRDLRRSGSKQKARTGK